MVAVACPAPSRLRAWEGELALLVSSHREPAILADPAWAPFQVYVLNPDTGEMVRERVPLASVSR
ncbi:hypothetical protein GCM10017688_18480 [Streptomyces ramulosus]